VLTRVNCCQAGNAHTPHPFSYDSCLLYSLRLRCLSTILLALVILSARGQSQMGTSLSGAVTSTKVSDFRSNVNTGISPAPNNWSLTNIWVYRSLW
jgi:hypothetical protein